MQVAGIKIVAEWDAEAVKKGMADLKTILGPKLGGLVIDNKGALKSLAEVDKLLSQIVKNASAMGPKMTEGIQKAGKELQKTLDQAAKVKTPSVGGASPGAANTQKELDLIGRLKKEMADSLRAVQNLTLAHGANSQAVLREQAVYAALKDKFDSVISSSKKQIDYYGRLSDLGARLTRHAQNMGAKFGAFSDQAQNAATRAKRVNDELAKIDANSGRYGRNVGNYASGYNAISVNMSRIIGEMPNFVQSVKIGFQSITNNIQPLKESIDDLRRKNQQLIAQGKPTESVSKAVASALFSWNTALLLGVSAMTAYGPKLWELVKGTDKLAEAKKRAEERQKELNQIEEAAYQQAGKSIGQVKSLLGIIENENASYKSKQGALKKLQDMYPTLLGNLTMHDAKSGKLARTIIDELVPAIEAEGRVMALTDKIADNYGKKIDLKYKQIRAEKDYTKALKERTAADEKDAKAYTTPIQNQYGFVVPNIRATAAASDAQNKYNDAVKNYKDIRVQSIEIDQEAVFLANELKASTGDINKAAAAGLSNFKDTATYVGKGAGSARSMADAIKETQLSITNLDRQNSLDALGDNGDYVKKKFDILQGAVRKLFVEFKQPASNPFIQDWLSEMVDLNSVIKANEIAETQATKAVADHNKKIQEAERYNERYNELFTDLNAQLMAVSRAFAGGLLTNSEKDKQELALLESAYQKLITTFNLPLDSASLKTLFNDINTLKPQAIITGISDDLTKLDAKIAQINLSEKFKAITPSEATSQKTNAYRQQLTKLLEILQTSPSGSVGNYVQSEIDKISQALEGADIQSRVDAMSEAVQSSVRQLAIDIGVTLGESIGNALNPLKGKTFDFFASILEVAGNAFQSFGKQLLAMASLAIVIDRALKALANNPALAAAAGIASIALGQVLKNQAQKKWSNAIPFANGGVVYGPTNALVGEYPGASSNPEVIAPLNRLKEIIGGGNDYTFTLQKAVTGSDMDLMITRHNKLNKR